MITQEIRDKIHSLQFFYRMVHQDIKFQVFNQVSAEYLARLENIADLIAAECKIIVIEEKK